jgi:DNA invertase Pin-like site-specific DNA recombinase
MHPRAQIGYARVSSQSQDTAIQVEHLRAAGCVFVREEKVSGQSRDSRHELKVILDFIRPGDTLVVTKLDRLGRSTRDVLNIVHELEAKGAHLRVLEPDVRTDVAMGKMILTVLGMVSEMELRFIRERQREGIEAAKLRGVYKGRPQSLDRDTIVQMRRDGIGPSEISKKLGCSRSAVYKLLRPPA